MNLKTINDKQLWLINKQNSEIEAANSVNISDKKIILIIQESIYESYKPIFEKLQIQYDAIQAYMIETSKLPLSKDLQ